MQVNIRYLKEISHPDAEKYAIYINELQHRSSDKSSLVLQNNIPNYGVHGTFQTSSQIKGEGN